MITTQMVHNRCLLGIYFGLISILIIGLAVITIVAKTSLLDEFQNDLKNCTGCDTVKGQINFIKGITLPVLIGIMAALVIKWTFFSSFYFFNIRESQLLLEEEFWSEFQLKSFKFSNAVCPINKVKFKLIKYSKSRGCRQPFFAIRQFLQSEVTEFFRYS